MAKTLFIEDELISLLVYKLKYHWSEEAENYAFPYLVNEQNEILPSDEFEFVPIPLTELVMENGDKMTCDGVLFFGDACIEFHDKEELDAYHWDNFTDESVIKVTELVRNLN